MSDAPSRALDSQPSPSRSPPSAWIDNLRTRVIMLVIKVSQSLLELCDQTVVLEQWAALAYFHEMLDKHIDLVDLRLIASLEHHGLNRRLDVGLEGYRRYVGYGVQAYNLRVIGRALLRQQRACEEAVARAASSGTVLIRDRSSGTVSRLFRTSRQENGPVITMSVEVDPVLVEPHIRRVREDD